MDDGTWNECNYLQIDEDMRNAGMDSDAEHDFNNFNQHTLHCQIDTGEDIDTILDIIRERSHNISGWSCNTGGRLEVVYDTVANDYPDSIYGDTAHEALQGATQ